MLSKRAIATAVAVGALAICAVMVVSFTGDDKPDVTDYIPPVDEPQDDTSDTSPPVEPTSDEPPQETDDELPDEQGDEEVPDEGDEDELPGDEDDDDDEDECPGKKKGLCRAIQVHERNMDKSINNREKSSVSAGENRGDCFGLENSLEKLYENLEKQESKDNGQKGDNGQGNDDKVDKEKNKDK